MSLSATLILAAAAASPAAQGAHTAQGARGIAIVQARVTAEILPAAVVRQAGGPEPAGDRAPRHQLSRRGNTVLVEYQ